MENVDIVLQDAHDNMGLIIVIGILLVYGYIKYTNCKK